MWGQVRWERPPCLFRFRAVPWYGSAGAEPEAGGSKCTSWAPPRVSRRPEGSDDAVLGQLMQLQVVKGLPRADDGDICREEQRREAALVSVGPRKVDFSP